MGIQLGRSVQAYQTKNPITESDVIYRIIKNRLHHSPIPMQNKLKYYRVQKPICAWAHGSSSIGLKWRSAPGLKGQSAPGLMDLYAPRYISQSTRGRTSATKYTSNIKIHNELFQWYRSRGPSIPIYEKFMTCFWLSKACHKLDQMRVIWLAQ